MDGADGVGVCEVVVGRLLKTSTRWIPVVYVVLVALAVIAVFFGGYECGQGFPVVKRVPRPLVSRSASLAQVRANFAGKAYVHGALSELPGFACDGWTNGKAGHGWVVLVCSK